MGFYWRQMAIVVGSLFAFHANSAIAQITPDATLPNNTNVNENLVDKTFNITGGTTSGGNLFHSFKEFSVPTGSEAFFNNGADIVNIINRVTGGSISNIDGLIKANGSANLFLMNPNGIVFGENARLDIGGSFLATSADSMKFNDGSEFSAVNPQAPPLLKVNITPGLQYGKSQPGATISNTGNLTSQQDLKLVADKLDLQGELKARRDLTLQAGDTVKVRDSVTIPFLAESSGNLTVQGNQGIDILALNHPNQSPFLSGGNLSLISDGIISGDARFTSGGNFSIGSLSGEMANFVSKYDPIISSNGDVDVTANYTGASLLVESKGNIRFGGDINITTPDTSDLPAGKDTGTLSNSTALIVRSGQENLAYGGVNSGSVSGFTSGTVPEGITIDGNVLLQPFDGAGGIVDLTTASGDINAQQIVTNGGAINLKADNGSITTGILNSSPLSNSDSGRKGGNITLKAKGSINTGSLFSASYSGSGNTGNGGAINLESSDSINITDTWNSTPGAFISGALNSSSSSPNNTTGKGGGINLVATNGINITGNSYAYSLSSEGIAGDGGDIRLEAKNGNITIGDLLSFSYSTSGSGGDGGAIALTAFNNITTGRIVSEAEDTGNGGDITLKSIAGAIDTTQGDVTSEIREGSNGTGSAGTIVFTAKNNIQTAELDASAEKGDGSSIQLTSKNGAIDTTKGTVYTESRSGNAGAISLSAFNNITTGRIVSEAEDTGNGGDITLKSIAGAIDTTQGDVTSEIREGSNGTGSAGTIVFTAKNNIQTAELDASAEKGDGSSIQLTSKNGAIDTTKGTVYTESRSGNAGAISLSAFNNITTGRIVSEAEDTGNGGDITLKSIAGAIDTTQGDVTSEIREGSNGTGRAGTIVFTAKNNIQTAELDASAEKGNGSSIQLTSTNGEIDTSKGTVYTESRSGNAGAISLSAFNNITTGRIVSEVEDTGNGGNITLTSIAGAIDTTQGTVTSEVREASNGIGNAGTIVFTAKNNIQTALLNVSAEKGDGGSIQLTSTNGAVDTTKGTLATDSKNGNGGTISLKAANGNINTGNLLSNSYSESGSTGSGGEINLEANNGSVTTKILNSSSLSLPLFSSSAGDGGAIILTANGNINTGSLFTASSSRFGSAGSGGEINLEANNGSINITDTWNAGPIDFVGGAWNSSSFSPNNTGKGKKGGNVNIIAGNNINVIGDSFSYSLSFNSTAGDGGAISLEAKNGSILTGSLGLDSSSNQSTPGNGGTIRFKAADTITTGTLATKSNSNSDIRKQIGGTISLEANNEIKVDGIDSTGGQGSGNITIKTSVPFILNKSIISSNTFGDGKGGDIIINAPAIELIDGSQLVTSTSGSGKAGNITVNANDIQLSGSESGLFAKTTSTGTAGEVILQPLSNEQSLKVNFQNGAQISASTESNGKGGTLRITAPESITLTGDGSIVSAETTGSGTGGDLILDTGKLTVRDKAEVTVSSEGSGRAGSLTVNADSILLDNQGKIRADTTGGGGDIFVNSPLLVLRRGSSITTNARGNEITGGNITIDGKNGFIVALPWENSDIRADSQDSRGGNVRIKNTAGIYGIQSREEPSPQSDITAKGATPLLSGTVQINTPDLDPSNGLIELPVDVVDASNQISTACTPGGSQFDNEFVVTGRGGLPMNPTEILQETNTLSNSWVRLKPQSQNTGNRIIKPSSPTDGNSRKNKVNQTNQIVEATGWIVDKHGNIEFVAQANRINPPSNGQTPVSCPLR